MKSVDEFFVCKDCSMNYQRKELLYHKSDFAKVERRIIINYFEVGFKVSTNTP